jgi:uncharacterized membrane protein YsdA (DUF1294 family)
MAGLGARDADVMPRRGVSPYKLYGGISIALATVAGAALWWVLRPNLLIVWIVALSIATFVMYGVDKLQARRTGLRVPEKVLHVLALLGGAIGGWAGMLLFRHKIRHPIFFVVLGLGTVVDVALVWILVRGA